MIKVIYLISFMSLAYVYIKNVLHMFQQNRYEFYRYTKWLFSFKPYYLKTSIVYAILMIALVFVPSVYFKNIFTVLITLGFAIYLINDESKKEYIKPLVFTARVKRLLVLFIVTLLFIEINLVSGFIKLIPLVGIFSIVFPYILIYPVALVMMPVEHFIKKKYENEARNILKDNPGLIRIGITGSYGKTTTKNIVTEILGARYYALMTPASYNTPMGITRTVRENLKPIHEVFVCEMGADHVNDIAYLMDMVKPKYGIVSSIGPQHLNTFGSLDNIIKEKMKEIEMLPEDGVGIINLDNEYIASYKIKNTCKIVSVGVNNPEADLIAKNVKYDKNGSSFSVKIGTKNVKFKCRLLGEHNITNILCGIALALEFGIETDKIVEAVENLNQVEHRLELKKINGYNFIDDAFNANPSGCMSALSTLSIMPSKRVIVTPGLIDLGEEENHYNYEFGKAMFDKTDLVILVGKKQTEWIYKGLSDAGYDMNNVIVVEKVFDAFNYIYTNLKPSDTILLENDLPDAFNV